MKASRAGGEATVEAADIEEVQSVAAETQATILPLWPYLDILHWIPSPLRSLAIRARNDDWKRGSDHRSAPYRNRRASRSRGEGQ